MNIVNTFLQYIASILSTISFFDILDIVIVAFLIYKAVQLVRETRAEQLVKGIVLLILVFYLSEIMGLRALTFIMSTIVQFGLLSLVVVFQPELRSALERLGHSKLSKFNFLKFDNTDLNVQNTKEAIYAVCDAAQNLQKNRIGALILFEKQTKLGEIVRTGTVINADISAELIENIFYPKAPLHDGAMILRNGKLYAAGCFLPLSQNQQISRELGTRHRAALGISENSDALVIVVSEETGVITLAQNGVLKRNLTIETLRFALEKDLIPQKSEDTKSGFKFFGK
jgi:diadenylate cyclase